MNNIQPKYVNFEQAKWLKEIGFDVRLKSWFDSEGEFHILNDEFNSIGWLNHNLPKDEYSRPEQWVVVEWLLLNHGIWVHTAPENNEEDVVKWAYVIQRICEEEVFFVRRIGEFNSPQEAYSVAFDYIKENNLI
jgi:hypothetical protein